MATVTVNSLVSKAQIILQDTTKVRWQDAELIDWLNDGQREVVLIRPAASVSNLAVQLTANETKQSLPADGVMLIDVPRNMGANGSTQGDAIRICAREVLDAQRPGWHSETNADGKIVHFVYDPRDPKNYFVYPKAPNTPWYVQLVYSSSPSTVSAGGSISIDDVYSNALIDYVLYRAYSKDAEYAGNAQRAVAHYAAFQNSLGVKTQNELSSNPNLTVGAWNPNVPGAART